MIIVQYRQTAGWQQLSVHWPVIIGQYTATADIAVDDTHRRRAPPMCGGGYSLLSVFINPRRACAARVTVLSLSVCECVCYLANSSAVNVRVQSKIRIESKRGTKGF